MYGYNAPPPEPEGSWGEVLVMVKVVFQMLAPLLGVLAGSLILLGATLVLLFQDPPLALIPFGIIVAFIAWLVRRDKRIQDEEERRILGR